MRPLLAIVAAALLAAAAGGPVSARAPREATVRIKDVAFKPEKLRVRPGTRVTWRFLDVVARHNVTSAGRPRFRKSADRKVGTHSVTFRRPGVYRYSCTLHPGMDGRVVVRRRSRR